MPRYAARTDTTQSRIVATLRAAGVRVEIIKRPVDLLTYFRGRWLPVEVKSPTKAGKYRPRRDQEAQQAFIAETGVPVVTSPEEALKAVGIAYAGDLP